jgi:hypothetical protein
LNVATNNIKFKTVIDKNTFYFYNPTFQNRYESYINSLNETLLVFKVKLYKKNKTINIKNMTKQYVYIAQSSTDTSLCKIGLTENLNRQIKAFNYFEGECEESIYQYIFICEVQDMIEVDYDTRVNFSKYRINNEEHIFFLNDTLFEMYMEFIKAHPLFEDVIFKKKKLHYKEREEPFPCEIEGI